jgi:hypothetical protein
LSTAVLLETISLQVPTAPHSAICIADMLDASINKAQPTMFVNIGLQTAFCCARTAILPTPALGMLSPYFSIFYHI